MPVTICRPCTVFSCYLGSYLSSKGKSRFYIYEFETLKNGVWAAKKPDKIGLFAGYIFFVPFWWRRAWDSNPRTVFGRQTISSRSRYDLFDSPPYISTVFRALRKCKKNTQEQYEILKFDPAKTLINQGFSAEKTARANAYFESASLRPLRYISMLYFQGFAGFRLIENQV